MYSSQSCVIQASFGIKPVAAEYRVEDSSCGEKIAVLRDHAFYPRDVPWVDFSGGGGVASASPSRHV